jgi:ABC-type lipoprotein release transport system permease subunit
VEHFEHTAQENLIRILVIFNDPIPLLGGVPPAGGGVVFWGAIEMGTIKRAVLHIVRKRGRTGTLLALFTTLITLALVGLSLHRTAAETSLQLRQTLGSYFRVTARSASRPVDEELVGKLLQNKRIRAHTGVDSFYLYTPELELQPGRFFGTGSPRAHVPTFLSVSDSDCYDAFLTERFALVEGAHLTPENRDSVLLSDTVAARNGLALGDTIEAWIDNSITGGREEANNTQYTLKIVGLFHVNETQNSDTSNTAEMDLPENYIFLDGDSGREIAETVRSRQTRSYSGGVTLVVDDPQNMESVLAELARDTSIDWDAYVVRTNTKAYDEAAQPLRQMEKISAFLLWAVVVLGAAILTLLLLLWMRERMREAGILLSIGVSKLQLAGQFLAECGIISVVAYILSLGVAILAIKPVADLWMEADGQFPLSVDILLAVAGAAAAVICLSVALSSAVILRHKPRDILSIMS